MGVRLPGEMLQEQSMIANLPSKEKGSASAKSVYYWGQHTSLEPEQNCKDIREALPTTKGPIPLPSPGSTHSASIHLNAKSTLAVWSPRAAGWVLVGHDHDCLGWEHSAAWRVVWAAGPGTLCCRESEGGDLQGVGTQSSQLPLLPVLE